MQPKYLFFLILISLSVFAQNRRFERYLNELKEEFNIIQINPDSLEKLNTVLLDTREKEEFDTSHIPNAIYAGYYDFSIEQFNALNKDTTIIVYCSVGYRSSKIAQKLIRAGFTDVRNLYGGIFMWVNQNHEIVKGSIVTDTLHTYNKRWGRYITNENIIKTQ
jgi:rhodanese-related sulfurtransferase